MKVTALLRDSTGFEKECVQDWDYGWSADETRTAAEFMWSDGNYACDCNRSLFLYDHDEDRKLPCSPLRMHGKPMIRCVSLKLDGEEIYAEAE